MQYLGIEHSIKNRPALDADFIPFGVWAKAYLKEADRPFKLAVERAHGKITVYETRLRGEAFAAANIRFAERLVKMLLWSAGGFRIYLQGDDTIAAQIRDAYRPGGAREFDAGFDFDMFERPLEVILCGKGDFPTANEQPIRVGGHTYGCRIGFDDFTAHTTERPILTVDGIGLDAPVLI